MLEPNYKVFRRKFISIRNERKTIEILINKPVCLGLLILELSKILMYEFWYDYVKPKYVEKAKLYYMDKNIKTDGIYKCIAEDAETRYFKL